MLGLSSLTVRCLLLTMLVEAQEETETYFGVLVIKGLIVSTQLLDSIGAGICNTLHIVITNDISCRTGRFSLMLGVTSSAMCLGATVSGYVGQAIAEDYGYSVAFSIFGCMSVVPLFIFFIFMPETLPNYAKPKHRRRRLLALLQKINEKRGKCSVISNPFRRNSNSDSVMDAIFPITAKEASILEVSQQ